MEISSVSQLIRAARRGRSQAEFAHELGVSQSTLSRYERGSANPKVDVIDHCMRAVHWDRRHDDSSVGELIDKLYKQVGRDDQAPLRGLLSKLIDSLTLRDNTGANRSGRPGERT
ncbi:multiprotein-bridging factor 1 family protein [Accumulibacter sp.]|uniref:helix-turn-helix domain-containing protein n=1 Tax=Accumulibacter sp. TaxID=2053492 RepID=UPI0035B4027C